MEEIAYAKINLALHVRAREPDGYHSIETLFAFAEDGDLLTVEEGEELSLTVTGPFAGFLGGGSDNLVLRAAQALWDEYDVTTGAALTLDKRLPVASGIGGGSADAAAALRLLNRWWKLDADEAVLLEIAASLGADLPACVRSEVARGEGRGDRLSPENGDGLQGMPLLLVNPGVPLSTASVFSAWGGMDRGPLGEDLLTSRNDLEPSARSLVPEVGHVLGALLKQPGVGIARMSGSGATCFGLFQTLADRDSADFSIAAAHPHWWRLATRIR